MLRLFADIFLDGEAYNAVKHGMAIQTGNSRLTITIDDHELGQTEGLHVDYLGTRTTDGRKTWELKTKCFDLDLVLQQIFAAQRMIDALWKIARFRYRGVGVEGLPHLDHVTAEELRFSESITWERSRPRPDLRGTTANNGIR